MSDVTDFCRNLPDSQTRVLIIEMRSAVLGPEGAAAVLSYLGRLGVLPGGLQVVREGTAEFTISQSRQRLQYSLPRVRRRSVQLAASRGDLALAVLRHRRRLRMLLRDAR